MAKQKTKALTTRTWDSLVEQASAEERRLRWLLEAPWYRVALSWGTKNVCVESDCWFYNNGYHWRTNLKDWWYRLPIICVSLSLPALVLAVIFPQLKEGETQLDSYIAKVEAFFREATEGVSDLPLLRRARELEAGGQDDLDKVDDVVETSLSRLSERLAEIQTEVQSALAGSEELFLSGGVSLEDDLKHYEDIAERLASAAFPKLPAKDEA